jgi:hypothetical protein
MDISNPDVAVMQAWLSVASDYSKLATGALILPVIFLRNLLGIPEGKSLYPYINKFLIASWVLLFISIGLGMLYQSVATCYIGSHLVERGAFACQFSASITFQLFTVSFLLGIGAFLIGVLIAFRRLNNDVV